MCKCITKQTNKQISGYFSVSSWPNALTSVNRLKLIKHYHDYSFCLAWKQRKFSNLKMKQMLRWSKTGAFSIENSRRHLEMKSTGSKNTGNYQKEQHCENHGKDKTTGDSQIFHRSQASTTHTAGQQARVFDCTTESQS